MAAFVAKINRFMRSSDGPTAVEYATLISLILLTCIAAVQSMSSVQTPLQQVESTLEGGGGVTTDTRNPWIHSRRTKSRFRSLRPGEQPDAELRRDHSE